MHHAGVSSWHTTHPNSVSANANAFPYDSENEDEEVDQLISDSDDADDLPQGEPTPSTSNKARSKPSTERVPGKSLIPHSRIDNILESDGELFCSLYHSHGVHNSDYASRWWWSYVKRGHVHFVHCHSKFDSPHPFNVPPTHLIHHQEEFIKRLAEAGKRQANSARRSTINYRDIGSSLFLSPSPFQLMVHQLLQHTSTKNSTFSEVCAF